MVELEFMVAVDDDDVLELVFDRRQPHVEVFHFLLASCLCEIPCVE